MRATCLCGLVFVTAALQASVAWADDRPADPTNYRQVVTTLRPGDTMRLAAGSYGILNIANLNGRPDAPIVIEGPATGGAAVFNADSRPCCNTIELRNSSYVVLRRVTVDGGGVAGAFGVSAGGGAGNTVHHVTVEGCTFLRHDGSQQTVAISTKTTTWGWVIRGNIIRGAGTGLYLGNSDGSQPFIAGLIENNLVEDTIGYNMEIKFQRARPMLAGMPTEPQSTIIRRNVWIKTDRASPDGNRPNVLVGGFPDTGLGSNDRYEVYGNVFLHNPRESLFQASGRVTVHDNLFGSAAAQGDAVVGNVIFSPMPISGTITVQRDNISDTVANAAMYVNAPSITPGMMDFYPRAGQCQGAPLDVYAFAADQERDVDFNCTSREGRTFRGAYAGEGTNPGWRIVAAPRPLTGTCGGGVSDGGVSDAGLSDAGASDASVSDVVASDVAVSDAGGGATTTSDTGCGCATQGAGGARGGAWVAAGVMLAIGRRRRYRRVGERTSATVRPE